MTDCDFCNFETLKVPDLKQEDGRICHVAVLKSKLRIHDCVLSSKRIPENVRYSLNDLPSVQFLKADCVLKRRFYTICPPIQRKRLWNCSRTCANLGRKPTTLIAGSLFVKRVPESSPTILDSFHVNPSTNSIVSTKTNQVLLGNFVVDLRYYFIFGFESKGMKELTRFVDFNQAKVEFINLYDLAKFYPLIFTPKVTFLVLFGHYNHWPLPQIWPLLPNLETVLVNSCFFPTSLLKITHYPKLCDIRLNIHDQSDFRMIVKFLQNQRSNFWCTIYGSHYLDLNGKSLLRRFVPVEKKMLNQKGLCFTFNGNDQFFVLP